MSDPLSSTSDLVTNLMCLSENELSQPLQMSNQFTSMVMNSDISRQKHIAIED